MINLRADATARTVLEDVERRLPRVERLEMIFAILELLEGKAEQAMSRANAVSARAPENEEARIYRADLAFLANAADLEAALEPER